MISHRGKIRLRIMHWLGNSLRLQILLAVAVLPFLLWWQLPFTPVSLLGNLIHPFFLIAFLAVSSILFFTTLIGLPNYWLCQLLVMVQRSWQYILKLHTRPWWLQLTWWHLLPALGIGVTIWVYSYTRFSPHDKNKIAAWCLAGSVVLASSAYLLKKTVGQTTLQRGNYSLIIKPKGKGIIELIDHGYITRAGNIDSLVDYEIMPHIITQYGQPECIQISTGHKGKRLKMVEKLLKDWGLNSKC